MNITKKTRKCDAFTLIECVVAIALLSFLVLLVSGFCAQIYSAVVCHNKKMNVFLINNIAIDRVMQDCFSASSKPAMWDIVNGVFTKETLDSKGKEVVASVGWSLCVEGKYRGALRRLHGIYDFTKRLWKKQTVSLVEGDFIFFSIKPVVHGNRITSVMIDYADHSNKRGSVSFPLACMTIASTQRYYDASS